MMTSLLTALSRRLHVRASSCLWPQGASSRNHRGVAMIGLLPWSLQMVRSEHYCIANQSNGDLVFILGDGVSQQMVKLLCSLETIVVV